MSKKANANEGRRMRITRPQLGCLIYMTANGRTEGRGAVVAVATSQARVVNMMFEAGASAAPSPSAVLQRTFGGV